MDEKYSSLCCLSVIKQIAFSAEMSRRSKVRNRSFIFIVGFFFVVFFCQYICFLNDDFYVIVVLFLKLIFILAFWCLQFWPRILVCLLGGCISQKFLWPMLSWWSGFGDCVFCRKACRYLRYVHLSVFEYVHHAMLSVIEKKGLNNLIWMQCWPWFELGLDDPLPWILA